MQDHPALNGLPPAFLSLFPMLRTLQLPIESRSPCEACPQAALPGEPPGGDRPFLREERCCTYQPFTRNFQAGRVLGRGGEGAERLRARLRTQRDGKGAMGIRVSAVMFRRVVNVDFGQDSLLACPYLRPGTLGCSIHADRNAVCRTWHCRYIDGGRSALMWTTVRDLLGLIEDRLAGWLVHTGDPPEEGASDEEFEAWYLDCARRLDAASPAEIAAIPFRERRGLELALRFYTEQLFAPLPERVVPVGTEVVDEGETLLLEGYSGYDRVRVPRLFDLVLALLESGLPWRRALELAEAEHGLHFEAELIERLWRRGVLVSPPDAGIDPAHLLLQAQAEEEGITLSDHGWVLPPGFSGA